MGIIQGGTVIEDALSRSVQDVSMTIGAEAGDVINVAIQMKEGDKDANERVRGEFYLSDDASGDSVAATAPSGGLAIGTDGVILTEHTANKHFTAISESDGDIDIDITEVGADTWYLIAALNDGRLIASAAITFA